MAMMPASRIDASDNEMESTKDASTDTGPVKLGDKTDYRHGILKLLYDHINDWQTRLLRIHPGQQDQPLQIDLVVVDLVHLPGAVLHDDQQHVEYENISYSWGAPIFDSPITLNGHAALITPTLHGALRRIRLSDQARLIWADAPCINQSNTKRSLCRFDTCTRSFVKPVKFWYGWVTQGDSRRQR